MCLCYGMNDCWQTSTKPTFIAVTERQSILIETVVSDLSALIIAQAVTAALPPAIVRLTWGDHGQTIVQSYVLYENADIHLNWKIRSNEV